MQHYIENSFNQSLNMSVFSYFKTGNQIIDTLVSTLVLSLISYCIRVFFSNNIRLLPLSDCYDYFKSILYTRYSITYEGKHSFIIAKFDYCPVITSCFSDTFKALFTDIITGIKNNDTIHEIKEYITTKKYNSDVESDMYIITQRNSFMYDKALEIYANTYILSQDDTNDKQKSNSAMKTDIIYITLFSYKTNINNLQKFAELKKKEYLDYIENVRNNKQFIYSLSKISYENSINECWRELIFGSSRTFDNIFFENKDKIVEKINFFLNNKDWYYKYGIPYTLGIGLHGPPGTGKTSFFKCLANLTGRHLIILSLKLIKSKRQLEDFFYENKYNTNNKINSIGFDKKIIVIEDIDCMGDIVLKRTDEKVKQRKIKDSDNVGKAIQKLFENNGNNNEPCIVSAPVEDPITLDDILNLFDGIKETPGRILGISSNHYDKLDPAITRPGRIDITLNLGNATKLIINEMFQHFYGFAINAKKLKTIKDKFYSPAEITNCYINNKDDPDAFIERLCLNQKF